MLGIASCLSPFGMSIVVPALPSIAQHFDASFSDAQYIISAYLFGLAIAQPVSGFLCDKYGRRPVMLTGFILFTLTSLVCFTANSLEQLTFARFFQAIGVSVGTVASRAILRDSHDRNKMAEAMSYIAIAMGAAPVIAPTLGGLIDASVGYSWIFLMTSIIGAIVFARMYFGLSETLPEEFERPKLSSWFSNYRHLFSSRSFVGNTLVFGFIQGSVFAFIAIGSLLFASEFGIGAGEFGLLWGLMAVFFVVGALFSAKLTRKFGTGFVMDISMALNILVGGLILLCASIGELTVSKVLVPFAFMMMLSGAVSPGAMTGAVADHPTRAGSASGLSSAIGLVVAGVFTIFAGTAYQGEYQLIGLIIFLSNIAAGICWLIARSNKTAQPITELNEEVV